MFVAEELHDRAVRYPDRVALDVVGGPALTYTQWDGAADATAAGLVAAGVQKGDRVGLLYANADAADFWVGYLAAHRSGAVAVPVNGRYAKREIAHVLRDAGAELLLSAGEHLDRARRVELPGVRVATVEDVAAQGSAAQGTRAAQVHIDGDDIADLFYTSGTTGLPKGVVSTHANAAHHRMAAMAGGGVMVSAIPLATFTGVQGALLTPMRLAITSVVMPVFDAAAFAATVEARRANFLLMVPAQILLLLESGALGGRDVSSVMAVMFGGSPTPPAAVEELGRAIPNAVLLNGYGLTEGGGSVCVLPPGEAARRPGSVGKPMGGVEVRIDGDGGRPVPPGEVGEVLLHLAAGSRRYWNDPAATDVTFHDGWVRTGDLGRVDEEGFLYIVGRTKEVIIRGGYNITPVEVENAIYEHPDVAEVAVIGIDHPMLGQDVCAVLRQRRGSHALDAGALREFLADRIADYKQPRRVVVVRDALPRTAAGKVDKAALEDLIAAS